MEKLLHDLLEAEILTTETAKELQESITTQLNEAIAKAKADATAEVTAQLNEQWITERDILIETLDEKITEVLVQELSELKEDCERFRDLEAEYAEKLVESKHELASKLQEELTQLVQKIDAVVEIKLAEEFNEFKDDIEQTRKNLFGKKVFEAFAEEFKTFQVSDESSNGIEAQLAEAQTQRDDAMKALAEIEAERAALIRTQTLTKVLAPLTGRTREVMEAILRNVDTPMLEDAYKTYIGRILKESSKDENSEKEDKVLAETAGSKDSTPTGVTVTGDNAEQLVESEDLTKREESAATKKPALSNESKLRLQKIAGVR